MTASVVLLQSDIVDSTQLAERLGDARMATVFTAHDRVTRQLLREWRGHEIDRSDGFLMRFGSVSDAVSFALACHEALAALDDPLQIRVGVHVGPLTSRLNLLDEVEHGARPVEVGGLSIPVTARVMSLAVPGQTLMTAAARAGLEHAAHRIVSHGHWRLKGVNDPFELFEVGGAHAPFTPPSDVAKVYCVVRRNDLWVPRMVIDHSLLRSATRSSAGPALSIGFRNGSGGARAFYRSWGLGASARPDSCNVSHGRGSATSRAASGSAICRQQPRSTDSWPRSRKG